MLNRALVVAHKEIVDSLRDVRSVVSSLLYALMGPLVVGLVSLSKPGSEGAVLVGMMSVFTLVAAFVGGMNIAMDTVAGERERKSLLPLLLNPVARMDIVIGKWLAVCIFAVGGLMVNLMGFAVVSGSWRIPAPALVLGIFPLALLAAALQLLVSTMCRAVKEVQTYLSMIVFLPMGVGMFLVFFPAAAQGWFRVVPLVGQQLQLELLMKGSGVSVQQSVVLGCYTAALALLAVWITANLLQRDEIVYGN